ncbi:MAG: hypothetical protein IT534_01360 [Bauldia sp.]|nr:hypothetical protein [Bauldia sp.]
MNVIQFAPRPTADSGLFEPLRSLAGLRPGDGIEQTGPHAARLLVEFTEAPTDIDVRREGKMLLVVAGTGGGASVLRRFDLAEGVSVTATRRTSGGCEIEFVRGGSGGRTGARSA